MTELRTHLLPVTIEPSPSNRAICPLCSKVIKQGFLRVSIVEDYYMGHPVIRHFHLKCFREALEHKIKEAFKQSGLEIKKV